MTLFVAFTVVMWLLLVGIIGYHVLKARRAKLRISQQWLTDHEYYRNGDVPPGTSRQEEGR